MTAKNSQNRRLGYARVSTYGQTLDAQLAQLRKEGCAKIYREKSGGARPDRRNSDHWRSRGPTRAPGPGG
jgi:hypothetical protein